MHRYGILGAGRQGTAAAYDLIARGEASEVTLGDLDLDRATAAARRLNRIAGSDAVRPAKVDATDRPSLVDFLRPLDAFVSAASFRLNLGASEAALEAGTHMCDLGGNTAIVRAQHAMDGRARERGVAIVPDCGEAPGLINNLVAYALSLLDRPADSVVVYDAGLPAQPRPPWNYELTFNIDGLTNEYDGTTPWLVDGELVQMDCLDPAEYELVDFEEPFGRLEAFPGATASTTPWTLGDRVRTLKGKILRYPGHHARFRAFKDLGLFGEAPVRVNGATVVPRDLYHALLEPRIQASGRPGDVVLAKIVARGRSEGGASRAVVDLRVLPDEHFTAMERSTGWHAAIVCHLMASGAIGPGAHPVELAVDPSLIVEACRGRGFSIEPRVEPA